MNMDIVSRQILSLYLSLFMNMPFLATVPLTHNDEMEVENVESREVDPEAEEEEEDACRKCPSRCPHHISN